MAVGNNWKRNILDDEPLISLKPNHSFRKFIPSVSKFVRITKAEARHFVLLIRIGFQVLSDEVSVAHVAKHALAAINGSGRNPLEMTLAS